MGLVNYFWPSPPNAYIRFLFYVIVFDMHFCMDLYEKALLRNQAKEMYLFAFDSYMQHAFPADEILPISCKGRYRQTNSHGRGDIDDILGNFSLTLIDGMDTLVIMQEFELFEDAVKKVIEYVNFDKDIAVSVFETNIRILGGLLSSHILVLMLRNYFSHSSHVDQDLKSKTNSEYTQYFHWYNDELLHMASDLGNRLLPAFASQTGIPYSKVNLRHGLNGQNGWNKVETCTACAGTLLLEFAALSRLTNNPIFESKAKKVLDVLWAARDPFSDLLGSSINVETGEWSEKESGVGAGADSYYEYLLKSYIFLGDRKYYRRFAKHYVAIRTYMSDDPFIYNVYMQRPDILANEYMDALSAFWPGLQVMYGDLSPAIQTHAMLNKVSEKYGFLPESFNTEFQMRWSQHFLRPELIESTYLLYQATKDDYYLEVGRAVLHNLQNYSRSACGFASIANLRTLALEDRMDSFVLSELLKYLYLLFAQDTKDQHVGPPGFDLDQYVMTTEAHLLPLSLYSLGPKPEPDLQPDHYGSLYLARGYKCPDGSLNSNRLHPWGVVRNDTKCPDCPSDNNAVLQCPLFYHPFPTAAEYAQSVRNQMEAKLKAKRDRDMDASAHQERSLAQEIISKIGALNDLDSGEHKIKLFFQSSSTGGPVSLSLVLNEIHSNVASAHATLDELRSDLASLRGQTNLIFAKQSCNLALYDELLAEDTQQLTYAKIPRLGLYEWPGIDRPDKLIPGTCANFGTNLTGHNFGAPVRLLITKRFTACEPLVGTGLHEDVRGSMVIVQRGECNFVDKVRNVQTAGGLGVIVVDNNVMNSDYHSATSFVMSGYGNASDLTIDIPSMFMYAKQYEEFENFIMSGRERYTGYLYSTTYWSEAFDQNFIRCWLPHPQLFEAQNPPFRLDHTYSYQDSGFLDVKPSFVSFILPPNSTGASKMIRAITASDGFENSTFKYYFKMAINASALQSYELDESEMQQPILTYLTRTESSASSAFENHKPDFDLFTQISILLNLKIQIASISLRFPRIKADPKTCSEHLMRELIGLMVVEHENDEETNVEKNLKTLLRIGLGEKLPLTLTSLYDLAKFASLQGAFQISQEFDNPVSDESYLDLKGIIVALVTLNATAAERVNLGDFNTLKMMQNQFFGA